MASPAMGGEPPGPFDLALREASLWLVNAHRATMGTLEAELQHMRHENMRLRALLSDAAAEKAAAAAAAAAATAAAGPEPPEMSKPVATVLPPAPAETLPTSALPASARKWAMGVAMDAGAMDQSRRSLRGHEAPASRPAETQQARRRSGSPVRPAVPVESVQKPRGGGEGEQGAARDALLAQQGSADPLVGTDPRAGPLTTGDLGLTLAGDPHLHRAGAHFAADRFGAATAADAGLVTPSASETFVTPTNSETPSELHSSRARRASLEVEELASAPAPPVAEVLTPGHLSGAPEELQRTPTLGDSPEALEPQADPVPVLEPAGNSSRNRTASKEEPPAPPDYAHEAQYPRPVSTRDTSSGTATPRSGTPLAPVINTGVGEPAGQDVGRLLEVMFANLGWQHIDYRHEDNGTWTIAGFNFLVKCDSHTSPTSSGSGGPPFRLLASDDGGRSWEVLEGLVRKRRLQKVVRTAPIATGTVEYNVGSAAAGSATPLRSNSRMGGGGPRPTSPASRQQPSSVGGFHREAPMSLADLASIPMRRMQVTPTRGDVPGMAGQQRPFRVV